MALYTSTATNDLTGFGRPKKLASIHIAATGTAPTVNLRDGGSGGTIRYQYQLAINTSKDVSFPFPGLPVFKDGLYVELAAGTVAAITVDVV